MLDIVQRHHEVSFYLGDITDDRDVLDILNKSGAMCTIHITLLQRGTKDLSIYIKANVEGTRAVIDTAIAAGVSGLIYSSSASIIFIGTDIVNVDEQVPYLEKLFNAYNLLPYHSTTSSKPRLDPEGTTAKLNESLHRTLPPVCATTKCHHMTQTLSSYVAPTPNAESILSVFNTPFNSRELKCLTIHSQVKGWVLFIVNGEWGYKEHVSDWERQQEYEGW
ncbi:hypothetical protein M404DRAFT_31730 [Pisolithus tinctorius Marx 270]|uniref:3-beta hydroxysteroid dehydrogenase/isomerase domain-containing protein n=1 Tax=Pisolithus tinctorius Marx 270 TaxID=870435 RepID=A0A0C3JKC3_PISTI|nr:hypothetical protein M404DRAFT_31730 [Pisolithus tinctorius Marx 270]